VLQCSHDGNARSVDESTVVVDDVYVGAESEAFYACNNAQRLGVEGVRTADGLFQYARQNDFSIGRPVLRQFYVLLIHPCL
jgi:hypothetical protein